MESSASLDSSSHEGTKPTVLCDHLVAIPYACPFTDRRWKPARNNTNQVVKLVAGAPWSIISSQTEAMSFVFGRPRALSRNSCSFYSSPRPKSRNQVSNYTSISECHFKHHTTASPTVRRWNKKIPKIKSHLPATSCTPHSFLQSWAAPSPPSSVRATSYTLAQVTHRPSYGFCSALFGSLCCNRRCCGTCCSL